VLAPLLDERDEAVLETIHAIVECGHALWLTVSIGGQAPSVDPDYADLLVQCSVESISVNPDVIEPTRRTIATEQWILLSQPGAVCPHTCEDTVVASIARRDDSCRTVSTNGTPLLAMTRGTLWVD